MGTLEEWVGGVSPPPSAMGLGLSISGVSSQGEALEGGPHQGWGCRVGWALGSWHGLATGKEDAWQRGEEMVEGKHKQKKARQRNRRGKKKSQCPDC